MKSPFLNFPFLLLFSPVIALATDIKPPMTSGISPAMPLPSASPVAVSTTAAIPIPAAGSNSATPLSPTALVPHALPEIHATMLLPKDWTLLPGKLMEGDVLLATREKINSESDSWTTGLSMTIDRNGAKDSGQKASAYALGIAREASQKAGEEASPITESDSGPFHEVRFDFPISGDQPLLVTEVLRANDKTGTLTVILWQSPKEEAAKLHDLREQILTGIKLDPAQ